MRKRWIQSALLAAILALGLLAQGPAAQNADSDPGAAAGRQAFDFSYEDINPRSPSHGRRLALHDLRADRGVVLNFIASWCQPCWEELPLLQGLAESERIPIVCVAADEHGPTGDLLRLAGNVGLDLPILHVPRAEIEMMEQHYDPAMLPATYVIDSDGKIQRVIQGALPEEALSEQLGRYFPKHTAQQ